MYIAIDIGGTNMRIASITDATSAQFLAVHKIPITNRYEQDLVDISQTIRELSENQPIDGIGLSIAGDINVENGFVNGTDYFKDWVRKPLASDLAITFNCPVKLQNDAAGAALGEAIYGCGKGQDFVFLAWGSGFGGAAIQHVNGSLVVFPFDPGHQIIHQDGRECACRQRGCLQAYVGGKEIAKIYGQEAPHLSEENWATVLEDLTQGLMNIIAIRPTRLMVFGGGIALNQPHRVLKLNELLRKKLTLPAEQIPEIIITPLGDNAALYGALALFR